MNDLTKVRAAFAWVSWAIGAGLFRCRVVALAEGPNRRAACEAREARVSRKQRARLDADGSAKPLTEIVGVYPAGEVNFYHNAEELLVKDKLVRWIVVNPDVWGHVSAECDPGYSCPCMREEYDENKGEHEWVHDDDACDCHEEVNDWFRVGTIETPEDAKDEDLVRALYEGGFLTREGREVAEVDDWSDGSFLEIRDREGRLLFQLEKNEDYSDERLAHDARVEDRKRGAP